MESMHQDWRIFRNLYFGDITNSLGSGSQSPTQTDSWPSSGIYTSECHFSPFIIRNRTVKLLKWVPGLARWIKHKKNNIVELKALQDINIKTVWYAIHKKCKIKQMSYVSHKDNVDTFFFKYWLLSKKRFLVFPTILIPGMTFGETSSK